MPRLFTGIALPEDVTARLAMLSNGLSGARWIEAADLHITLSFIGDVDIHQAHEVSEALKGLEHPVFSIAFNGLDVFGGKKPRTLYARVANSDRLVVLQKKHEHLMRQLGLDIEGRKYVPHATLARFRGINTVALASYLAVNGGFSASPFLVEHFLLFSARDSTGGGPYIVEQSYPLMG
jgi:2'-5' RNA ligase